MRGYIGTLLLVALFAATHLPSQAQEQARCFDENYICIGGRILDVWEQNQQVLGLPIEQLERETTGETTKQFQWFEWQRLELHPEQDRPYDVMLGPLGVERLAQQGRDWRSFPRSTEAPAGCRFFAETGQPVCGAFLAAWRAHGLELDGQIGYSEAENLALFGLPISPEQTETLADGNDYTVQWFERARLERHPELPGEFKVQPGRLVSELRGTPAPTQTVGSAWLNYVFPVGVAGTDYGRYHHDYPATDIFCPTGSPFLATTSGVVDFVSRVDVWNPATNRPEHRSGMAVAIIGDDGVRYYGSHLSGVAEGIEAGVRVAAGQVLGWTGKSGNARNTPPHLHYGISRPTTPDDWAVRRGEFPPYDHLRAWERGEMVPPDLADL